MPSTARCLLPHLCWLTISVLCWQGGKNSVDLADTASSAPDAGPKLRTSPAASGNTGSTADSASLNASPSKIISLLDRSFSFPAEWDALECVRAALSETNEYLRLQLFHRALERQTPETAARMQEVFDGYDKQGRWFTNEYTFFLRSWGELDGKAAAEFAAKRGGGDPGGWSDLIRKTVSGWASTDPEGVVKWVNESEQVDNWIVDSSIRGIVDGMTGRNPDQAVAFVLAQAAEDQGDTGFSTLTEKLVYGPGLKRAEQWLEQIPAAQPEAKAKVLSQLVDYHLRGGPDGAAALLGKVAPETWVPPQSVTRVALSLLSEGGEKYGDWLQGLPAGPVRDIAVQAAALKR